MKYRCYASCGFGIEGILSYEMKELSLDHVRTEDARVYFDADESEIAKANFFLRTADRVYIVLKEFDAVSFGHLFDGIAEIDLPDFIPSDARISVSGNAVKSKLGSVSDVQSIAKKALIRAMEKKYHKERFEEEGNRFHIFVNLVKDRATVALNTSGAGLNRRGYRLKNVAAPLKETLAAALIFIARWKRRNFYDPMCGSGTIAIEAAMQAADIAPGLYRHFDAQTYSNAFRRAFAEAREYANTLIHAPEPEIFASDIDADAIKLAKEHAENIRVAQWIRFERKDVAHLNTKAPAVIVTNPPYAVRLGDKRETAELYRKMGKRFASFDDTLYFVLSADEEFEKKFGRKADKKRKLYNGNMKCTYYQYFRRKS